MKKVILFSTICILASAQYGGGEIVCLKSGNAPLGNTQSFYFHCRHTR